MEKQDRISNSEKQFPPDKTFDFYEVYDKWCYNSNILLFLFLTRKSVKNNLINL
jgi:hypothetical protein